MILRHFFALVVLVGFTLTASAFAPAPLYKDPPKPKVPPLAAAIQGTWELQQNNAFVGRAGRVPIRRTTTSIRIENGVWTYMYDFGTGKLSEGTKYEMVLDANQNPATLDLKYNQNIPGAMNQIMMKGIVKVEGDTMTFAYVHGQNNVDRPKDFSGAPIQQAPGNFISASTMTLKRVR